MDRPKYPDDFLAFDGKYLSDDEIDAKVASIWDNASLMGISGGDIVVEKNIDLGIIEVLQKRAYYFIQKD